ncbi:MAG: serine/threonine-protein kinase [Myxococcota bacterium]
MENRIVYGDYHLLGRLNTGGMAEVFLGRRVDAGPNAELLAIKRMLPRYSQDEEFSTMFQDEARIAGRLEHPNICRVVDQGAHQEQLFIVMEFVHGKDMKVVHLRANERGERIPETVVAYVLASIADALDHAHTLRNPSGELENLVHRDVSPQNILVSYDGQPKLIDFGVARAKSRVAQTRVGIVKGKFAYMSPEQATARPLDGRSDVWALGVVFYQLLTGELPFRGTSDLDTLRKIATGQAIPITDIAPDTPSEIVDIIARAMQPDANDRYQRAGEFANDCRAYANRGSQPVNAAALARYMKRLFEKEYSREIDRVQRYRAGADAASIRREKLKRASSLVERMDTDVLTLAAGYRADAKEGESLDVVVSEATREPDEELEELGSGDIVLDPEYIDPPATESPSGFVDEVTDESPSPIAQPNHFDEPTQHGVRPVGLDAEITTSARSHAVRRVLLTSRQLMFLAAFAIAGLGVVAGTYVYAVKVPLVQVTDTP